MKTKRTLRKIEKPTLKRGFIWMAIFFVSNLIWAINPVDLQSIFDVMNHTEVLDMTIETNLTFLKENRRTNEYQPAKIQFRDKDKIEQNWNLKVRLRGNFRRLNCTDIPPLKLNFKKSELEKAGLSKFDDLKLVTTCIEDKEEAKNALFKEYLTYKLYNSLTENSFRVQLLRLTYRDTHTGKKTKSWGFLIEDTAQMRDRIGAEKVEQLFGFKAHQFDENSVKMTSLFQYLIGNSDFELAVSKNVKIVEKNGRLISIPYDFDFAGLVEAPYAVPNPDYELTSTKDRVFLGYKEIVSDLHSMLYVFKGKEKEFEKIIRNFKLLSVIEREEMTEYLDSFYENMENIQVKERSVQMANIED